MVISSWDSLNRKWMSQGASSTDIFHTILQSLQENKDVPRQAESPEVTKQKYDVLNFVIKLSPFAIVMDGIGHHMRELPGSSFIYMLFPSAFILDALICRWLLSQRGQYPVVERNFASIFLAVLMLTINEGRIYTNPDQFQIHYP